MFAVSYMLDENSENVKKGLEEVEAIQDIQKGILEENLKELENKESLIDLIIK